MSIFNFVIVCDINSVDRPKSLICELILFSFSSHSLHHSFTLESEKERVTEKEISVALSLAMIISQVS